MEYDFTHNINTSQLLDEISVAGLPTPSRIDTVIDSVQIYYNEALSVEQESCLNSIVSNHIANYHYVPAATQTQVSILLGYLNNADMSIANIARAVIVANLAPNMPAGMVLTINTQIANRLNGG